MIGNDVGFKGIADPIKIRTYHRSAGIHAKKLTIGKWCLAINANADVVARNHHTFIGTSPCLNHIIGHATNDVPFQIIRNTITIGPKDQSTKTCTLNCVTFTYFFGVRC